MRAFLTGAAGFVGRHLARRLARDGLAVTATDRELDVSDAQAVDAAIAGARPTLVVHLAAVSSVPASRRDPGLTYRVNFLGARAVLDAVERHAPDARVLIVGSADQYGSARPGAPPFDEATPQRPASPYARSKAAADLLAGERAARGLDVVRTRAFNHTGPGQTEAFVLPSFARQAVEIALGRREPLLAVGNLDSVRDFLAVEDVVDAYARLASGKAPAGVYNVASGRGVRIGEALDAICRIAGVSPRREVDPGRWREADFAAGDASRLRQATGWEPRRSLEEVLASLVEDWRQRLSAA